MQESSAKRNEDYITKDEFEDFIKKFRESLPDMIENSLRFVVGQTTKDLHKEFDETVDAMIAQSIYDHIDEISDHIMNNNIQFQLQVKRSKRILRLLKDHNSKNENALNLMNEIYEEVLVTQNNIKKINRSIKKNRKEIKLLKSGKYGKSSESKKSGKSVKRGKKR